MRRKNADANQTLDPKNKKLSCFVHAQSKVDFTFKQPNFLLIDQKWSLWDQISVTR